MMQPANAIHQCRQNRLRNQKKGTANAIGTRPLANMAKPVQTPMMKNRR